MSVAARTQEKTAVLCIVTIELIIVPRASLSSLPASSLPASSLSAAQHQPSVISRPCHSLQQVVIIVVAILSSRGSSSSSWLVLTNTCNNITVVQYSAVQHRTKQNADQVGSGRIAKGSIW